MDVCKLLNFATVLLSLSQYKAEQRKVRNPLDQIV